ncbi:MAG TPA: NAD(P)/FAD-dependent oxidoreductase [Acidimicrobiales bacterium]|nr:NAD(P)/FAD-dependent oxidoreductase [Acidimicrobiales bacterium]
MNVTAPGERAALTARGWDCVVVGGGHNGLAAAAYLARGGLSVVVLERRDRVGGACTLERPFADERYVVSPCAYLVGLLDRLIIDELALRRHGYRVHLVDPHLWCPFEDGTSLTIWDDDERTAGAVAGLAPGDVDGYLRYTRLFARIRTALRGPPRDLWLGEAPTREEVEERLGGDPEAVEVLFEASIADVVERHVADPRLRTALHGQGVIGTCAGPRDPGTALVHAMHSMGTLEGTAGAWGYVEGGMGCISLALAGAAREAGAAVVTGMEVGAIVPGQGVLLGAGELVPARVVVANVDPKRAVALCGDEVPEAYRRRVDGWRTDSPVVKVNCGLARLPRFTAAGPGDRPERAMVTVARGIDATQEAYEASRRGQPAPEWCELYFHTAYDPSVAPPGRHTMSVFAQYAPATLATGDWRTRREEIGDLVLATVARFAPDVADAVEHRQVLGPPDVESRIGLAGGHIFQGECLPDQMWDRRLSPRTPMPGVYLCGAATHPGGGVSAINGRNAAMAVLADLRAAEG